MLIRRTALHPGNFGCSKRDQKTTAREDDKEIMLKKMCVKASGAPGDTGHRRRPETTHSGVFPCARKLRAISIKTRKKAAG